MKRPPLYATWCYQVSTAHLFTGKRAACGVRWSAQFDPLSKRRAADVALCVACRRFHAQRVEHLTPLGLYADRCQECGTADDRKRVHWYEATRLGGKTYRLCQSCAGAHIIERPRPAARLMRGAP